MMSANQNTQSNDIEKVIYFIILRPIEEKAQLDIFKLNLKKEIENKKKNKTI
jgi:hypothetical protein